MQTQNIRVGANAVIIRDGRLLLVKFDDETGPHFNFPGGGVHTGESLHEAVRREVREETGMLVDVGRLLFVIEYVPSHYAGKYGPLHKIGFIFLCSASPGTPEPHLPAWPDKDQVGVHWLPLENVTDPPHPLIPDIGHRLILALQEPQTESILIS